MLCLNDNDKIIFKSKTKNIIEEKYNFKIINIKKNEKSTDKNVYNLFTDKNEYILKIYNSKKHVEDMSNLLKKLKQYNFYIPQIYNTIDNKSYIYLFNKYIIIYSYLAGKEIGEAFSNLPDDISILLASKLKKFHDVTKKNLNLEVMNFWNKKLRTSILHFDLTRSNIFYNKNKNEIGFIDFDDAKYGQTIIDISILIANVYISKLRGIDIHGIKTFINEYYKNESELKKEELPLIKDTAIKWINKILDRNKLETSTIDSLEIRKKLISKIDFCDFN